LLRSFHVTFSFSGESWNGLWNEGKNAAFQYAFSKKWRLKKQHFGEKGQFLVLI